jgi:hypothetical protein
MVAHRLCQFSFCQVSLVTIHLEDGNDCFGGCNGNFCHSLCKVSLVIFAWKLEDLFYRWGWQSSWSLFVFFKYSLQMEMTGVCQLSVCKVVKLYLLSLGSCNKDFFLILCLQRQVGRYLLGRVQFSDENNSLVVTMDILSICGLERVFCHFLACKS